MERFLANPLFATIGFSPVAETNCNNSQLVNFVLPEGGSGGVSNCTIPSGLTPATCAGGYIKPAWQSGQGVPADGKRDIPDVSLFASNGFLGSFYIVCQTDQTGGPCNVSTGQFLGFGGTSVSSPAFAGIMALVNQETGSRHGNANYVLYKLASQQPTAFHDVTTGTNAMPCATGSPNCTTSVSGHSYGVLNGYNAGANYDLATGLGSVDANNLVTKWNSVTLLPSTTTLTSVTPTTITHGQAVSFTATVKPSSGTGTPTGLVSLEGSPTDSSEGIAGFNLTSGTVSGSTELLTGGAYALIAHYPGDSTYGPSDSGPVSVTVNKENSTPQAFLVTFNSNGTVLNGNTTTTTYGTPYILRVNVENSAGRACAPAASSGATACPSGDVTLTNNGSTLDAGTYLLNSDGYVEDLTVQLPGGTDSVKAAYAGDESFNASTGTTSISISQAITTTSAPTALTLANVGQPVTLHSFVNTTSSGAGPSGTVTFFANGVVINGTLSVNTNAGGPITPAFSSAELVTDTNAFPAPGTYSVTATYNGDGNYKSSTSAATSLLVQYPAPTVITTPNQQTVSYGTTATVTALVDTTNKTTYPTGSVTFVDADTEAPVFGPTPCGSTKDASGYFACQAVATFTVTSSHPVNARYSGDMNYPPANAFAYILMPDFSISRKRASRSLRVNHKA